MALIRGDVSSKLYKYIEIEIKLAQLFQNSGLFKVRTRTDLCSMLW